MKERQLKRKVIQRAVDKRSITISDLAFDIGYSRSYLSAVINGSRKANDYILEHIATALGISFNDLFESYEVYIQLWRQCRWSMTEWDIDHVQKIYYLLTENENKLDQLSLMNPEIPHHNILIETFLGIQKNSRKIDKKEESLPLLLSMIMLSYRDKDWQRFQHYLLRWEKRGIQEEHQGIAYFLNAVFLYYQRQAFEAYEKLLKAQDFFLHSTQIYLLKLSFLFKASLYSYLGFFEKANKIFQQLETMQFSKEHHALFVENYFFNLLLQNRIVDAEKTLLTYQPLLNHYLCIFNKNEALQKDTLEDDFIRFMKILRNKENSEKLEHGIIQVNSPLLELYMRKKLVEYYQKQRKYKAISSLLSK